MRQSRGVSGPVAISDWSAAEMLDSDWSRVGHVTEWRTLIGPQPDHGPSLVNNMDIE